MKQRSLIRKKGALSLDNYQNLVDHEAFTARLGNSGVFSVHNGAVPNRGRLGELRRFLNYLKAAKNDKKIMGPDNLLKLKTWVDALYAVHVDIRGHT